MSKFCPSCGEQNNDSSSFCQKCGATLNGNPVISVPNYLAHSILAMIFCCLPFGVVALIYAAQVNGLLRSGNVAGAREASEKAKKWSLASLFTGIGLAIIYIIVLSS